MTLQLPTISCAADSLQALSGIRIALGAAIPAVPFMGKAKLMRNGQKTHCKHGHPLSGENVLIRKCDGARECKTCRRIRGLEYKHSPKVSRETIERVFAALREGQTLANVCGIKNSRFVGGRIIDRTKLQAFKRHNPKASALMLKMASENYRAYRAGKGRLLAAPAIRHNDGADVYSAVIAATRALPDYVRDEVRSSIFLALAEGKLKLREIGLRVQEFVRAQNRIYTKFVPNGGGVMQSLDQQVYDDGPTKLVDTVTHGLWD